MIGEKDIVNEKQSILSKSFHYQELVDKILEHTKYATDSPESIRDNRSLILVQGDYKKFKFS
jgi:hypothetical protein